MGDVVQLQKLSRRQLEHEPDQYFGGCPHCGGQDGYLNLGRNHWFFCDRHKTTWCIGSNLFSGWRDETEEDWLRNEYKLNHFITVEPLYPEPTP